MHGEKYTFKEFIHLTKKANYSLNKFIYTKQFKLIHSKKIFIQVKNGLTPRALGKSHSFWSAQLWRVRKWDIVIIRMAQVFFGAKHCFFAFLRTEDWGLRQASDLLGTAWLTSWSSQILSVLASSLPACLTLCHKQFIINL